MRAQVPWLPPFGGVVKESYWQVTAITQRLGGEWEAVLAHRVSDGWATWIEGEPRYILTRGYCPFEVGNKMTFIKF